MTKTLCAASAETASAMNAAVLTINLRLWDASLAAMRGQAPDRAENDRMVAEKTTALWDGLFAATTAMNSLWWTPPRSPQGAGNALAKVWMAGMGPGFRKTQANARRLSSKQR